MKKLLFWPAVVFASLIALLLIAFILLNFFLPLNAIKDFAETKLSQSLNHTVKIKSVSFHLFSGIKLNGVEIGNARGYSKMPLLSAKTLELKYAFWPLFQGKVIIPEINFVTPTILIEKGASGTFNFSDMLAPQKKITSKKEKPAKKGAPVDFIINNFRITKGLIIYKDHYTGKSGLKDLNVSISNITLVALKPIEAKASATGSYLGKNIPLSLALSLGLDLPNNALTVRNLVLSIAGDTLNASADIKNYTAAPQISITASSQKIMLDPFLALFAAGSSEKKEAAPHGAMTRSLQKTFSAIPANLSLAADLDLKNISLKTLKIDSLAFNFGLRQRTASLSVKDFSAYKGKLYLKTLTLDLPALSYALKGLELHGFTATPFLNDMIDSFFPNFIDLKNNVEGALDASLSLSGSGIEMPEAFDNLNGSGVVLLAKGRLKKIKALTSIGEQYNLNTLKQDISVGGLRIQASLAKKILSVAKLTLQDTDVYTEFKGGLDFAKMQYVPGNRLSLRFSPAVTQNLPRELSVLKDEKGFVTADFELQGSLIKPMPSPVFQGLVNTAVGKFRVKVEAKQLEIETAAKTMEAEARKKLEEEAKKKIKEILKF